MKLSIRGFSRKQTFQIYTFLTLGAIVMAVNFNLFVAPSQIAPGGVTGITLIINDLTGLPYSGVLFFLQFLTILLGFRYLGRRQFLIRSLYTAFMYSLLVGVLAPYFPAAGFTNDLLLDAVYGGVLGGIGSGLVFWGQTSMPGTGVISRILQLRTGIPISQLFLFVDGGIILTQGIFFGWERALYAMMMLFIWGIASDYLLEGPSVVRTIFIITTHPEAVARRLFQELGVGVTRWASTGMYRESHNATLFCTVNRPDVAAVKNIVKTVDPEAFLVVGQGHQAVGGTLRPGRARALPPEHPPPEEPAPPDRP